MKTVITIEHLSKSFGKQKAVDDFSFEVHEGEVFAFLGNNGAGKTTTFRCMLGIYEPDTGEINILGQRFSQNLSPYISYLPEERGIYTKLTVKEIFEYFGKLRGITAKDRDIFMNEYLERVDLVPHAEKKILQLSSGMQQKVQIGISIMHKPKILILDEPFRGLDPVNRQLFLSVFEELRAQGTTILYSTHMVDEVQKIASRLVMIKAGKRVLYGEIEEIRNSFGSGNIHLSFKGTLPTNPKLYTTRQNHTTAELTPHPGVQPSEILTYLIQQKLEILEFTIDRPSLNEIFIQTAGTH